MVIVYDTKGGVWCWLRILPVRHPAKNPFEIRIVRQFLHRQTRRSRIWASEN
jgi:hypothetical protein